MTIEIRMLLGLLTGLGVSFLAIPPIVRVAQAMNLYVKFNGRNSHQGQVPSFGGVAIFASVMLGTLFFIGSGGFEEFRFILPALIIIFFIGLKDDLSDSHWLKKLFTEIFASFLVVILADVRITTFHGIFGIDILPFWFSIIFTIFVFIALINCFNLIDGIDGLASGMGIVISLVLGYWLYLLGLWNFSVLSFALAGGLISFYGYNVFGKKNKLFMGDTGSLIIGFMFAVLSVKILGCELLPEDALFLRSRPTVVVGLMIIPIMDTLRVIIQRLIKGHSPFKADKTHLHHIFLDLGFTHKRASLTIIVINLSLFGLTLIMRNMNSLVSMFILFSAAMILISIPWYFALKLKRQAINKTIGCQTEDLAS